MVEILLFAVLSVYLAYRLWGVLGTRTGSEKQRQWSRPETIDDNVIILPQKSTGQHAEPEVAITVPEPFISQLKTIKKSIKDFSLDRFQAGSVKVLKGFQAAIKTRTKQKETVNIDIKDVEVEVEDIILVKTIAQILVRFTSDQVVTTTNKAGEIIDNTNLITNRMIDRWTFEKDLKEAGPIWLLVKTESLA